MAKAPDNKTKVISKAATSTDPGKKYYKSNIFLINILYETIKKYCKFLQNLLEGK